MILGLLFLVAAAALADFGIRSQRRHEAERGS
jgi:hypothetical protein